MIKLCEAKKCLMGSASVELKGLNYTFGKMSHKAFKNPKWGASCNVVFVYVATSSEGKFLLLSEFKKDKFCDEKWSLSEAEHVLVEDDSYIMTNLVEEEKDYIKK